MTKMVSSTGAGASDPAAAQAQREKEGKVSEITYKARLVPNGRTDVGAHVSQYDIGRIINVYIYDSGGELYELSDDAICTLNARKPDGTVFSAVEPHETEYVQIVTEEQLTCVSGNVTCELRITEDDTDIGTANFLIRVETSPIDTGSVSETTISSIAAYLQTAADAVTDATAAASAAASSATTASEAAEEAATSASEAAEAAEEAVEGALSGITFAVDPDTLKVYVGYTATDES